MSSVKDSGRARPTVGRKSEANSENNAGNAHFQRKEFAKAVECYNNVCPSPPFVYLCMPLFLSVLFSIPQVLDLPGAIPDRKVGWVKLIPTH